MKSFDEILGNLQNHASGYTQMIDSEPQAITVTAQRKFQVPEGYDLVLAYAGDVNSQIVTFALPKTHEGHDLTKCSYKKIKWKNLASGAEGTSTPEDDSTGATMKLKWEVPPELMTQAGVIEIAISIYDISANGTIAFSWNTATFSEFRVENSFSHVGSSWTGGDMPAKNEILNIDTETRQIVAPVGYNAAFCNYGDIGTAKIFFALDKKIQDIDIFNENTNIYVNVRFGTDTTEWLKINKENNLQPYAENADKVLMRWDVPPEISNNEYGYIGKIEISLKIEVTDGTTINKRWVSSSFSQLAIDPSLLTTTGIDIAARDEDIVKRLVEENMKDIGQSDWNNINPEEIQYILNKPAIKTGVGLNSIIANRLDLNEANAPNSISIGWNNIISEKSNMGFISGGSNNLIDAHCGFAANDGNTTAGKSGATFNQSNINRAEGGFVSGLNNILSETGIYSNVRGGYNEIQTAYTDASGYKNKTIYLDSTKNANYTHIEGSGNEATENASCSHLEGAGNIGNAKYVHVQGWKNIGSGYAQDVMGRWNKEDPDKVAIVGWGDPNTEVRKNIYDLDKYGNARFGGSITLDFNNEDNKTTLTSIDLKKIKDVATTLTTEKLAKIIKFIDSIEEEPYTISGKWAIDQFYGMYLQDDTRYDVNFSANGDQYIGILDHSDGCIRYIKADGSEVPVNYGGWVDYSLSVVDFGATPQTVSEQFYSKFTYGAKNITDAYPYSIQGVWRWNHINCETIAVNQDFDPGFRTLTGQLYTNISTDPGSALFYDDGYVGSGSFEDERDRIMNFGEDRQEVSELFYAFFVTHASPYNGTDIPPNPPEKEFYLSGDWIFSDSITFNEFSGQQKMNFGTVIQPYNGMTVNSENNSIVYNENYGDRTAYHYGWEDEYVQEIRFGTTPQKVGQAFYKWFTSNASKAPQGTLEGTWKFNDYISTYDGDAFWIYGDTDINFTSNDTQFVGMHLDNASELKYIQSNGNRVLVAQNGNIANNPNIGGTGYPEYQTVIFTTPQTVTQRFYVWFTANATKIS